MKNEGNIFLRRRRTKRTRREKRADFSCYSICWTSYVKHVTEKAPSCQPPCRLSHVSDCVYICLPRVRLCVHLLATCQTVCAFACHVSDCVCICLPRVRLCVHLLATIRLWVHLLAMCQTVGTFLATCQTVGTCACYVSGCGYICLPRVRLLVHLLAMCQTVHLLAVCQTVCTFFGHVSDCGNTNTDYESLQGHVSDCGITDTGPCVRQWQHGHTL